MELEDGCLGGFLSIAELERYFIHGEYNVLYLFLLSSFLSFLIGYLTINLIKS